MTQSQPPSARLGARVEAALRGADWTLHEESPDHLRVDLGNRAVVVRTHDGPGGDPRWSVVLLVDGETVSKFGRYDALDDVAERVARLQRTEVGYTVCCDGTRPE